MRAAFIYVSGPIGPNDAGRQERVDVAVVAARALIEAGLFPFVPHLWSLADGDSFASYESWLAYDLAWLERCDAVLRIPGESPGADREVARAKQIGLPTFFTVDGLLKWARERPAVEHAQAAKHVSREGR